MSALLRVRNVRRTYRGRAVLRDASLCPEPGTVTFLAGRNGAGKTTLLRIAAGLERTEAGSVTMGAVESGPASLHRLAAEGLFALPSGGFLVASMPAGAQVRTVARWAGRPEGEADEVIARLGLAAVADARPGRLSGGERRRMAVAAAVVRRPGVLLADEPTRGVAPIDADGVLRELRALADAGCAVVVTGHDVGAMMAVADRVVWVVDGGTVAFASPAEARADARFRAEVLPGEARPSGSAPGGSTRSPASASARPDATGADPAPLLASHVVPGISAPSSTSLPPDGPVGRPIPASSAPGLPTAMPQTTTPHPGAGASPQGKGDAGPRMRMDRQTLRDLEIFEAPSGRGLFDVLDRTRTPGGRARLKRRWSAPMTAADEIAAVQDAVSFLAERPDVHALLPDEERMRTSEHHRDAPFAPEHADGRAALAVQGAWWRVRHAAEFAALEHGLQATRAVLRAARTAARRLREGRPPPLLAAWADDVLDRTSGGEMHSLALDDAAERLPAGSVFAADRTVRGAGHEAVSAVVEAVHELDALASMAAATRELGFAMPRLDAGPAPRLEVDGAWHPFVAGAVGNAVALDGDARLVFLTGPNMAGKTTYMRTAALCVFLAQTGMGVPATAMRWAPFDALLAGLGTADDTRRGYSYFYAEVRRVKDAAAVLSRGRAFVLFDEMFKGTNVRDAFDASLAVVRALADCPRGLCVVSSHLAELGDALRSHPHVRFHCFDARLGESGPVFDYRLKDGVSAQRLGMVILQREGVLQTLASLANPLP